LIIVSKKCGFFKEYFVNYTNIIGCDHSNSHLMQEQFIKYLKAKSKDNTSFIEEVAFVLDIGYDAAYRRVNLKTNLSLEESVILARHYNVSLNKLYEVGSKSSIVVDLSPHFHNVEGLEQYFRQSHKNIESLVKLKSASIS